MTPFNSETGGHRIQRIPPTETKGRVHTSTVTVAVIEVGDESTSFYPDKDFDISWFSGTGCGGQYRNKHQNSCRLKHLPTGLETTSQTRSRQSSLAEAKQKLISLVEEKYKATQHGQTSKLRKEQVGSGQRGDKIRTYRFKDDVCTDHNTGKSASVAQIMKGKFNLIR